MTPRSSGKTPYEIRLELLILATEILMAQHAAKAVASTGTGTSTTAVQVLPTTYPTSEEIIQEAEKLNVFVSQTQSQQH